MSSNLSIDNRLAFASSVMPTINAANASEDPVKLCEKILQDLKEAYPDLKNIQKEMDNLYEVISNIDYDKITFDKINSEMTQIADAINTHSSEPDWNKISNKLNILQIEIQAKTDLPKDTLDKFIRILRKVKDLLDKNAPGESTQDLYQKLNQLEQEVTSLGSLKDQIKTLNDTVRQITQASRIDIITLIGTQIINGSADGAFNEATDLLENHGGNSDDINSAIQNIYRPRYLKTIISFVNRFSLDTRYQSIYPDLIKFLSDKIQYDYEHDPDLQGDSSHYYNSPDTNSKVVKCNVVQDTTNKIVSVFANEWFMNNDAQKNFETKYTDYDWEVYTDIMRDWNNDNCLRLKTGKNLTIYARQIITSSNGTTIEVSGQDGAAFDPPRAKDASNYGENGAPGHQGNPGGKGGNLNLVVGFVEKDAGGPGNLTLKMTGGKGGKGQDGGHGFPTAVPAPAADGKPSIDIHGGDPWAENVGAIRIRGSSGWAYGFYDLIYLREGSRGSDGQNGTKGGEEGGPGNPGSPGQITECVRLDQTAQINQDLQTTGSNLGSGMPGNTGRGQRGGTGGYHRYFNCPASSNNFHDGFGDGLRWYDGDSQFVISYADNNPNIMNEIAGQYKDGRRFKVRAPKGRDGKNGDGSDYNNT